MSILINYFKNYTIIQIAAPIAPNAIASAVKSHARTLFDIPSSYSQVYGFKASIGVIFTISKDKLANTPGKK